MTKKTYRPKVKLQVFYTGGPIRLAADGATFACACLQETKIVDCGNGSVLKTLPGDGELVTAIGFTPDGRHLYTASRSLFVKKWCVVSGECLKTIKGPKAPVSDICVDTSGSIVALASADRSVTVYDVNGGFRTHTFKGHKLTVTKVLFHPTEGELLSCSADNTVKVWDLHNSKLKTTLTGHNSAVSSVTYSDDGRYFVSAGRDNTVIVWSSRTYAKCVEFPVFEFIEDVICMPSIFAKQFVTSKKKSRHPCIIIASGGERGSLRMWRSDTGSDVFRKTPIGSKTGPVSEITSMQKVPGTNTFLIARTDCSIEFVEVQDEVVEGVVDSLSSRFLLGNMDEITDVTFLNSNATRIAVASNSPHIQVLDGRSLNCIRVLTGHSDAVLCIAATEFKSKPLLISGSKDQSVRVWDPVAGQCLADGTGHAAAVTALAASKRDSKLIITVSSDKLLKLWKLKIQLTAEEELTVQKLKVVSGVVGHAKEINCVDIAPNDALAATGSTDKTIKLFTVPSLAQQSTLQGHKRGVWSVQFSQTEKTLLSSSADTTIKIWSLTDSTCLRTFEGHSGSILKALFLSQSQQVLSCGGDGLLKLWNVSTCECVSTFDEHEDRIWSIAFSGKDQELMVSGGSDSTLIVWEDTTELDKQVEIQQQQEELTKQQNLSNAIQLRDFRSAARLAFELEHPRKLLSLLKKNLPKHDHVHVFSAIVDLLVDDDSLKKCLEYVREWNTNAKHCEEAQTLLRLILERYPPQRVATIPGVSAILEAIESYTVRHFGRLQKLHQAAYVVDYILDVMQVLTPDLLTGVVNSPSDGAKVDDHKKEVQHLS